MQVEHRITIATSADTIFRIYEDVQHWPTWDTDTKQAFITGSFRVGARGRITPPKGMSVPIKQLNAGLPITLRNLKMLAEQTSAA